MAGGWRLVADAASADAALTRDAHTVTAADGELFNPYYVRLQLSLLRTRIPAEFTAPIREASRSRLSWPLHTDVAGADDWLNLTAFVRRHDSSRSYPFDILGHSELYITLTFSRARLPVDAPPAPPAPPAHARCRRS